MRGTDVSSDPHLLVTAVRLWLRIYNNINNNTCKKFNMVLIRSKETQAAFKISLSNLFQPLQELIEDKEKTLRPSGDIA
jgi:hypothetical protein